MDDSVLVVSNSPATPKEMMSSSSTLKTSTGETQVPQHVDVALVALLGCHDEPTDGVEDYCIFLEKALRLRRAAMELVRVPWAERGWLAALRWLWRESAKWHGRWVLVQYTALGWSRRGFPLGFLPVLFLLQRRKLSIAVIFHDARAYPGTRWVDRIRRARSIL